MAGRYDRIQVYNGSAWKTPTQIQVYNGSNWVTLGTHTGDNQAASVGGLRHLYVHPYSGNSNVTRVTKQKQVNTVVNYSYSTGAGSYENRSWVNNQWTYNYNWNWSNADCRVRGTFRKTSAVDQNIFYSKDNNNSDNNFVKITWLADGKIQFSTRYGGGTTFTHYSDASYPINAWVTIEVYKPKGTGGSTYLYVNGVHVKTWNGSAAFAGINKVSQIGDTYMQMRDSLRLDMYSYPWGNAISYDLNMSNNMSAYGFGYAQDVSYVTNWV